MKEKEKWYKKGWVTIMSIVLGFVATPIVMSQIIKIPTLHWTIGDDKSWIGFLGGYVGAFIGSIITIIIFKLTIKQNRLRDKDEQVRFEKQMQVEHQRFEEQVRAEQERFDVQMKAEQERHDETKAVSIRPFLTASEFYSDSDYDRDSIKKYEDVQFRVYGDNVDARIDCKFQLKNVGLGTATNINFHNLMHFEPNAYRNEVVLQVGERVFVFFSAVFPSEKFDEFNHQYFYLFVTFKDLLGNEYTQTIALENRHIDSSKKSIYCKSKNVSTPRLVKHDET